MSNRSEYLGFILATKKLKNASSEPTMSIVCYSFFCYFRDASVYIDDPARTQMSGRFVRLMRESRDGVDAFTRRQFDLIIPRCNPQTESILMARVLGCVAQFYVLVHLSSLFGFIEKCIEAIFNEKSPIEAGCRIHAKDTTERQTFFFMYIVRLRKRFAKENADVRFVCFLLFSRQTIVNKVVY